MPSARTGEEIAESPLKTEKTSRQSTCIGPVSSVESKTGANYNNEFFAPLLEADEGRVHPLAQAG